MHNITCFLIISVLRMQLGIFACLLYGASDPPLSRTCFPGNLKFSWASHSSQHSAEQCVLGFGWRMSSWPSPADFLKQFMYMFFIITWKFCSKLLARVSTTSLLVDLCSPTVITYHAVCLLVVLGVIWLSCQHVGVVLWLVSIMS